VAIGGRGTLIGAALGAVLVNMGKTYFTSALPEYWLFALGLLFILVTLFLPQGIVGLVSRRRTIPEAPKGSDVEDGKVDPADVPAAAR
jgi:urea transport system permease protein